MTMATKRKAATGAVVILGVLSSFLVSNAIFGILSFFDQPIRASGGGRHLSSLDDTSAGQSLSLQPGLSNYNFNNLRKSYYNAVYGGIGDANSDIGEEDYKANAIPQPALPSLTEIQRLHGSSHIPLSTSTSLANLKSTRDPNEYAYLIIHYHKTGHDLSRSLRDLVSQHFPSGPQSNRRDNGFAPRYHHPVTKCPKNMNLNPGEIVVQAAPNLFCDAGVLAELMLDWRDRREGLGMAGRRIKRGVKVVHLVRNPFTMAISNFHYHAQYPTPENWVKTIDPCTNEYFNDHQTYPDLTLPTLLAPPPNPNKGSQPPPILTPDDFQSLSSTCRLHYRTRPRLKESSYYTHLRHLHPKYAVLLSTIHMMTQGVSGGDILRMANNIIKLRQMTVLLQQMNALHHIPAGMEKIQVLTLSMDDFIVHPEENAKKILDFFFDDDVMPLTTKNNIVTRYVQDYLVKLHAVEEEGNGGGGGGSGSVGPGVSGKDVDLSKAKAEHITNTRRGGSNEELIGYLKQDEVVGRVLGRVEELVDVALRDGSNYFSKEIDEYER